MDQIVLFMLDEQSFGISIKSVERIVRAVEITALSDAPEHLMGVVNIQGRVIPVFNIRRLLGVSERAPDLSDLLMIARIDNNPVGFVVDEVSEIFDAEFGGVKNDASGIACADWVVKCNGKLVQIVHDLGALMAIARGGQS